MKKIVFFSLSILLVTSSAFAQSKAKPKTSQQLDPFTVIVSVGSNWSIFSNPQNSASTFTQAKQVSGFNLGIAGNWPVAKNLALQVGLRMTQKGSRVYADTPYLHVFSTPRPLYLQVPVGFEYTYKLDKNFKLFVGLGGYIAKGIGGKSSYAGIAGQLGEEASVNGNDKIIYGNPTSNLIQAETFGNLQKIDYGVNGIIGIKYWKLRLALGYEQGLATLAYGSTSPNPDSRNKSMSLTVGIQF
ncbi:MAG TPA: outer membrane beta-barrel protein [Chitinophagaceae bacterium]|nr:outer membrane beta-barrel protein [Chitinophagaceae bacterium]